MSDDAYRLAAILSAVEIADEILDEAEQELDELEAMDDIEFGDPGASVLEISVDWERAADA